MNRPTKGTLEAEVANAVSRFQREQQGRGPADVRVNLIGDLVLVRTTGIFTQTESHLAASEEGRRLIVSARRELRSINRAESEQIVAAIAGCAVVRSYYDLDVLAGDQGEQMEIYILETDVEKRLLRQDLDRLSGLDPGRRV